MPDKKLTDSEIIKALEERIKDLPCIHEKYEPACGMWCEHLHKWCIDFNNKSLKENCSEYKPCCSMSLEKQVLDLINRQKAECKDLKFLYENLKEEHLETIKAIKHLKAEAYKEFAEVIKKHQVMLFNEIYSSKGFSKTINNLLKELVGEQPPLNDVKCIDCKYLEFKTPYGVCSKAYKGIVHPDDSCGKGKLEKVGGGK